MNLRELETTVASITLKTDGDPKEMKASEFVDGSIPDYQRFWKLYVFPYRDNDNGAFLNPELPRDHEALCIFNYSIFRSLTKLNRLMKKANRIYQCSNEIDTETFDDCIICLDIIYSQIRHFYSAVHSCFSGLGLSVKINKWERVWEILDPAPSLKPLYNEINTEAGQIRKYPRNYIAHAAKFPGDKNKIPKSEFVDDLIYWSDFHKAMIDDEEGTIKKLVDRYEFLRAAVDKIFELSNKFWQTLYDENMKCNATNPPINEHLLQKWILAPAADVKGDGIALPDVSGSLGNSRPKPPTTPSGTTGSVKFI